MRSTLLLLAIVATGTLGPVSASFAHDLTAPGSPSALNEAQGTTSGLGSSHRFGSVAAAQAHCGGSDPIVWSDGSDLTYELPASKLYGKSTKDFGFYACRSEADSAGFHAAGD